MRIMKCLLLLKDTEGGGGRAICDVRYPGVYSSSILLTAVLCESPANVHFRCLLLVGFCYGFCEDENTKE